MARTVRRRLDAELVRRGLVETRTAAQEAIAAGLVTVDGAPAGKAATQVHAGQALHVLAPPRQYVSRGGHKLAHGLDAFSVDPRDRVCLDAGVSTGGFTDCLLQRSAAHVIAVDVGYGQVHERIRVHPQVDVRERTNIKDVTPESLAPHVPTLVVSDLSFIRLSSVLGVLRTLAADDAEAIVLVKPQFEVDRDAVGKGGVVRDPSTWGVAIERVADAAEVVDWPMAAVSPSPLLGPSGNVEFVAHLVPSGSGGTDAGRDRARMIADAVAAGIRRRREGSVA